MGTVGTKIVKADVAALVEQLNKAYADEWLAYYQYFVGAKVVKGLMKEAVIAELLQHAADELRHAGLLADRIVQLGGTPILEFAELSALSGCGYDAPSEKEALAILRQNVKGERCAITTYTRLLELTKDRDIVTYNILMGILTDEVTHEEDLQNLQEDIEEFLQSLKQNA